MLELNEVYNIQIKAIAELAPAGFAPLEPHFAVRPVTIARVPAQAKVPQNQINLLPTKQIPSIFACQHLEDR